MRRKVFIFLALALIFAFNLLLTYGMLWGSFFLFFQNPQFSHIHYESRNIYACLASLSSFSLIWISFVWAVRDWIKKNRFYYWSVIAAVIVFGFMHYGRSLYPDMNSERQKNGYFIKVQKWYLGGDKVYKRWKSKDSIIHYESYPEIIWELDSINKE